MIRDPVLYLSITNTLYSFMFFYVLDKILNIKEKAKYFFMHSVLNTYIVVTTAEETLLYLTSPDIDIRSYNETSIVSASVCIGFHLYHYLTSILDFETKIHHLLTVFLTGSCSILIQNGPTTSAINFFMCGLPGGIDYILLVLLQYKKIDKITEKWMNRWLNLLIRMPGMFLVTCVLITKIYREQLFLSCVMHIITTLTMLINSIYYCNKVVGNFHVYHFRKHFAATQLTRAELRSASFR